MAFSTVTSEIEIAANTQMQKNDTVRRQMLPTPRGTHAIDGVAQRKCRLDVSPSAAEPDPTGARVQ
jgi:hypothetical protein